MTYSPHSVSPSSRSDATLVNSPYASPCEALAKGLNAVRLAPAHAAAAAAAATTSVTSADLYLDNGYFPNKATPASVPLAKRRNAFSSQSSNDDTIVCYGPGFGAVFGNVSGGSGNLLYAGGKTDDDDEDACYFTAKRAGEPPPLKRQVSSSSSSTSSPSIAFYLSPTYGLPELVHDRSTSSSSSASTSDEDDEFWCASTPTSALPRSPPSYTLSTMLDGAPVPPPRRIVALSLLSANRRFFDAIHKTASGREQPSTVAASLQTFSLTLPTAQPQYPQRPALRRNRGRQSSQRVSLKCIAEQASSSTESSMGLAT